MAELTLDRPELFPTETSVSLFFAEQLVFGRDAGPLGAPHAGPEVVGYEGEDEDEEPIFGDETAIVFTAITDKRHYIAAGKVDGEWRYVAVAVGNLRAGLSPPAAYPQHAV